MPTSHPCLSRPLALAALLCALGALLTPSLRAENFTTINVSGTGSIDSFVFSPWATSGTGQGVVFEYDDASSGTSAFTTYLTRPASQWEWYRADTTGTARPAMTLSNSNQLILTGTQHTSPGTIVIDPTSGAITINGQQVVATSSGITNFQLGTSFGNSSTGNEVLTNLWSDNAAGFLFDYEHTSEGSVAYDPGYHRFTFYSNHSAMGMYLFDDGSIGIGSNFSDAAYDSIGVDSSGNVSFEAGMITLDTSGDASFAGSVGIGTSTPQANLDVQGTGNFTGPVYIQPQGDISMGAFNYAPPGTPPAGGGGDDGDAMIGGGHGFSAGAGTSGTTSGTNGD